MALWKDSSTTSKDPVKDQAKDAAQGINLAPPPSFSSAMADVPTASVTPTYEPVVAMPSMSTSRERETRRGESVITSELSIEGKIEGTGNVRIAGKFKGEVNVQGNLVIEQGAIVTANVRAQTIQIAGQLEGNIEGATRVELMETAMMNGDVTADALTVAAGSRMRGRADFGWTDKTRS
jgi:cytoskeletal protein CcmA (bactofilin family)